MSVPGKCAKDGCARGFAMRESLMQHSDDPKKRWYCAGHYPDVAAELTPKRKGKRK